MSQVPGAPLSALTGWTPRVCERSSIVGRSRSYRVRSLLSVGRFAGPNSAACFISLGPPASEVCGRSLGVRSGSSYPLRLRRQSRCAAVASRWGASSSFSLSHCVLTAYETLRNRALGMSKTQTSRRKEARDGSRDDSDWDRGRLVVIAPPRFSEAPWAAMSLAGALAGQNPFQSPGEPRLLSVRHAVDFGRWCRHTGRQRRYEGSVRAHRWRS
jgi:hypothetical protein